MRSLRALPALTLACLAIAAGACGTKVSTEGMKPAILFEPVRCVAVMPFDELAGYPESGQIVADLFATELYHSRKFQVIDRMEVEQAARRVNLRLPTRTSAEFARRLGERMGVDGVFYGSVNEYWYPNTAGTERTEQVMMGDEPAVGITARLVAVDSGEVLWSASVSRSSYEVFSDLRDPLSRITQLAIADATKPLFRTLQGRRIDMLGPCGNGLTPINGRLSGTIADAQTGKPVGSAAVFIKEPVDVRVEVNAETGAFLSGPLPAGTASYAVLAQGYETAKGEVEIPSNETATLDVKLKPLEGPAPGPEPVHPAILGGRVLNPRGEGLEAKVKLDPDPGVGMMATNPANGRFKREIDPGKYTVLISAENYKPKSKEVQLDPGQNFFMEVTLDPVIDIASQKVRLEKDKLVITEQIFFRTGAAELAESSYPILLEVAEVLKANPRIKKVQVEGHTDDRGGALANQRLSQKRAEAVVRFLVQAGVESNRLTALGFGEAVPIADNNTEDGRARNRRVEFTIIEQDF